jgi:hypothetical protein
VACLFLTSHPTSAQANFRFILISSTAAIYPGEIRRSELVVKDKRMSALQDRIGMKADEI